MTSNNTKKSNSPSLNITVTDAAKKHMQEFLQNRGKGIGIRLGVQTAGCSGMAYLIEFVDVLKNDDQLIDMQGITIVIDSKSAIYLNNIVVDYQKKGLNSGFKFTNPNATGECGCGESFTI